MSTNRLPSPCMVCGKELAPVFDDEIGWRQPSGAAEFTSSGHYGSAFDPMSSRVSITINVCDECLKANRLRVVMCTEKRRPSDYTYTEFMPWLGNPSATPEGQKDA